MATTTTTPPTPTLEASYTSPTNAPFSQSTPLPSNPSADASEPKRTTQHHLASLRGAIADLQTLINAELTDRMAEDKAREEADEGEGQGSNGEDKKRKPKVDEKVEEDNYGEEMVDEED